VSSSNHYASNLKEREGEIGGVPTSLVTSRPPPPPPVLELPHQRSERDFIREDEAAMVEP